MNWRAVILLGLTACVAVNARDLQQYPSGSGMPYAAPSDPYAAPTTDPYGAATTSDPYATPAAGYGATVNRVSDTPYSYDQQKQWDDAWKANWVAKQVYTKAVYDPNTYAPYDPNYQYNPNMYLPNAPAAPTTPYNPTPAYNPYVVCPAGCVPANAPAMTPTPSKPSTPAPATSPAPAMDWMQQACQVKATKVGAGAAIVAACTDCYHTRTNDGSGCVDCIGASSSTAMNTRCISAIKAGATGWAIAQQCVKANSTAAFDACASCVSAKGLNGDFSGCQMCMAEAGDDATKLTDCNNCFTKGGNNWYCSQCVKVSAMGPAACYACLLKTPFSFDCVKPK